MTLFLQSVCFRHEVQCHNGYFCTIVADMALLTAKAAQLRATLGKASVQGASGIIPTPFLTTDPRPATGKIATLSFSTRKGRRATSQAALFTPPPSAVKYLLVNGGVDVLDVHCAAYSCTFTVPASTDTLPSIASIKSALTSDVRIQVNTSITHPHLYTAENVA